MHISPLNASLVKSATAGLSRWKRSEREALLMASTAYALIMHRRGSGEPWGVLGCELAVALLLGLMTLTITSVQPLVIREAATLKPNFARLMMLLVLAIPSLSRFIVKAVGGAGTAWEMVMLSTIGLAAFLLVVASRGSRDVSLSVICSGFLTLFTTAISDSGSAIIFALGWLVLCLYWMIANHWERLEVHLAQSVQRNHSLRLTTTAAGLLIATLAMLAVMGREPTTRLLTWGVMPTSGGHRWSDPAARSGVGDGDALVAAKDHASSFGPVDSGIFLQSDLPSLFDMFDDTLGEVVLKRRSEKAVALPNQKPIGEEQKFAESQQGNASFSIAREPKQQTHKLTNKPSVAAFHWIGPHGISLAMQRFNRFDGTQWQYHRSSAAETSMTEVDSDRKLVPCSIDDKNWFCRQETTQSIGLYADARSDAIKFINLQSTRIPAADPMIGVNVKDVDRDDFFAVTTDDCWCMPGRSTIPALTVVNILSRDWNGDELASIPFAQEPGARSLGDQWDASSDALAIRELAKQWTADEPRGWPAICEVVRHLRSEFEFDRSAPGDASAPLKHFLEHRRGGDHLFATAATLMLQSIGYEARLASGFYIDPGRYDRFAGHTEVMSDDVHLWTEVKTESGVWIPLEPTPGFLEPHFERSLWNRACEQFWICLPWITGTLVSAWLLWLTRAVWGEWLCLVGWWLSTPMQPSVRIKWLVRLLDLRSRLAGCQRPAGVSPSRWFQAAASDRDNELSGATSRFFAAADRVCFSPDPHVSSSWLSDASKLARRLTVRRLRTIASHASTVQPNLRTSH